jgi:hypothetical protein
VPDLATSARRTPLGILLLTAVLGVIGTGSTLAGAWVTIVEGGRSVGAGLAGLIIGPSIVYLAWSLLFRARWAWVTLLAVIGLLFISSVARIFLSPDAVGPAVLEILVEAVACWYLVRPRIRAHFPAR